MNKPTIRELQKQLGQLNLLVEETKQREKQAILAEIGEHVKEYGITEIELLRAAGFIQAKRQKAPAMYYDPDSGKSWSGKGQRPKWLADKNLDDYLIREAPKPWWPERT
ncbi:H-NS family nucleoid-associated regulatory protein [Burkholderia sola]|uniref:H-NS histone family protein n=1 Tax=Burkholderia sola TaxID=2843302 RepID=UPI001C0A8CC2|nr:histone family protein nucleoid-structuring protein H-NS [Burkholderia cenocepacia]CAG2266315.1 histone family protein nucleoid-structuring protein H-NS [Burkholderia cenocepacia]CAG2266505.1 histone family protein nucleoid-structuring protein H-NS [Burkholderia cenocepacia]CAG2266691.1 histone family protein nucleoid-structuring protein H-NS [Burkholderia cenocepacia]CAG2266739.1 histone family protein nucleoid-structuring protein H-NS [Burkholderia cenocepacia]